MATKISTILDRIDNGSITLPVFQRGYVWARKQVSEFFNSLYRDYPVGSLLIWETSSPDVRTRGETSAPATHRQILLDGQQRITSLYGVIRGREPAFFNGNAHAFQNLRFNLEDEVFEFFQPVKMQNNPLWIDVTELYSKGTLGVEPIIEKLQANGIDTSNYLGRLMKLLNITERDMHIDSVTSEDKTIEEVVNIFDRVNSGGTKLTQGDLALAKICSEWAEARETMQAQLLKWRKIGYDFSLDWLLRITNVIISGRGLFTHMHKATTSQVQDGLQRAEKYIDQALTMISNRLGLDHNQVLFAKQAFPIIIAFLDKEDGNISPEQRDKLLHWYAHAGMWGRYSGTSGSTMETDLMVLQNTSADDSIDGLLENLRRWRGGLKVEARNFHGATRGNRFYPVLYMMTRMGGARDLYDGQPLNNQSGEKPQLELHHLFPKFLLHRADYDTKSRNALANFCFLTKDSTQKIRRRPPIEYLEEIAEKYPGVLESQWIPMKRNLWEIHKYENFLNARKRLLAEGANQILNNLLTDHTKVQKEKGWDRPITSAPSRPASIADDEEEAILLEINQWMKNQNLPTGILGYEIADPDTGEEVAMFDLAWPEGVQSELSDRVAVLIDEDVEVLAAAGKYGYRFFTSPNGFKQYINEEILMSFNENGLQEIIQKGESETVEFKSSLRMNLHINKNDPRLEHSVIKTLAGFLNHEGGTLLIGVADDGTPLGVKTDKFKSEDKMTLHLVELVKSRMGHTAVTMIHIDYGTYKDHRIMRVVCDPSPSPIYVKDGNEEHFYVRMGPSTDKLRTSEIQDYIKHRFNQ